MSRYSRYPHLAEDNPCDWFEANVFLDRCIHHLRQNYKLDQNRIDASKLINGLAENIVNEQKAVAA